MASTSNRSSPNPSHSPPIPAGGMASPAIDPPAASGKPLQGQTETNGLTSPPSASAEAGGSNSDDVLWRAAAMELGRDSYFRHRSKPLTFQQADDELASEWNAKHAIHAQRVSWQQARELARDAWDQAQSALESGDAKPSAR